MFPYYPAIRCWKASVAMQESRRFHNKTTDHRCCDMPMQYAHPSSIYHHSHAGNESWCTVFMTVKALLESRLHVPPEIVAEIRSNHQHNAIFPIECETSLHKKTEGSWSSIQFFANPFALSTNFGKQNIVQPWRPKLCSNHHFVRGIMYTCTTFSAHPGTQDASFSVWDLGSKRSSILSQQKYSRNNPWPFHIFQSHDSHQNSQKNSPKINHGPNKRHVTVCRAPRSRNDSKEPHGPEPCHCDRCILEGSTARDQLFPATFVSKGIYNP